MEKVKVGINGYGVIGKRIADAILLQDDMELVGVTARTPDYRLFSANKKGIKVFGVDPEACNRLMNSGVKCNGDFNHFIKRVDVVIDATPAGIGKENKVKYDTAKVKSIFQGGEEHELTGFSFVSNGILEKAYMALARRGTDPVDSHEKGPLGTVVLEDSIPSHQGPDAQTVIPNLNILTIAIAVPTTIGHLHMAFLRLSKEVSIDEVVGILKSSPRVVAVNYKDGITAENQLAELMRDLGRPRADMWEGAFWEDLLHVEG